jgi:hypothetical protein
LGGGSIWGTLNLGSGGDTKQSLVYFLLHFQSRNHNNMQMDLTLNSVIQLKQQSQNHPSSHTQIGHLITPVTKKDSIRL